MSEIGAFVLSRFKPAIRADVQRRRIASQLIAPVARLVYLTTCLGVDGMSIEESWRRTGPLPVLLGP